MLSVPARKADVLVAFVPAFICAAVEVPGSSTIK
jgi:hypothetical protein